MADITANLGLPLLLAGQAQKHVTHNEALALIDLLVQGVAQDAHRTSPPAVPLEGHCHVVAAAPTGLWAGQAGRIAGFVNGGWIFITPRDGWRMSLPDGDRLQFAAGSWQRASSQALQAGALGINTLPDAGNALAVAAPASLFSHAGSGHQLKINKASGAETASLLFQSNWSGRAEMGLMGQDDFAIKLSADGSSFIEALRLSRSSGLASGTAVASTASDTTAGRLLKMGAGHQQLDASLYRRGNILGAVSQSSGVPSGAILERGSHATHGDYCRFADGSQIVWLKRSHLPAAATTATIGWTFPAAFVAGGSVVVQLSAQDNDPGGSGLRLGYANLTAGGCDLMLYRSAALATELAALAIGRWV